MLALAVSFVLAIAPAASALDSVTPSTVAVHTATGSGTGFVVEGGGVLTAAHVVGGERSVVIALPAGERIGATVTRIAAAEDLALLEPDEPLTAAPLRLRHATMQVGETVLALGYPLGMETASLSRGVVSALRDIDGVPSLQTDAAINEGLSGGPLLDEQGRVVGVIVSKMGEAEGIGMAVAADVAGRFIAGDLGATPPTHPQPAPPSALPSASPLPVAVAAALIAAALGVMTRRRKTKHQKDDFEIHLSAGRPVRPPTQQKASQ